MIGTLDRRYREATVVGAGIAGMLTAYALDKQGFRVTLLEQKARAGGLIRTTRTEQDIAESAAHSLLVSEPVRELCRELGVQLVEPRKEASANFIMRGGHLVRFPLKLRETVRLAWLALWPRARIAQSIVRQRKGKRTNGIMPANKPHALKGQTKSKLILTMIRA